jgi:hypothetical protein
VNFLWENRRVPIATANVSMRVGSCRSASLADGDPVAVTGRRTGMADFHSYESTERDLQKGFSQK